jgi:hypothetical protein
MPQAKPDGMKRYLPWAGLLSAAGFAFSGYLSAKRMLSGVCAFSEPCPFFLGHPACYYGFALFATLLGISVFGWAARTERSWPAIANAAVSAVGVLFAGRLAVVELAAGGHYAMLLPTCAWGLLFFLAVLISSLRAWLSGKDARAAHGLS